MVSTTIITLAIVSIVSIASSVYKDRAYQKTINDLLNRLMARDLTEYSNVNNAVLPKGKNKLKEKYEDQFKGLYE